MAILKWNELPVSVRKSPRKRYNYIVEEIEKMNKSNSSQNTNEGTS